MSKQPNAHKFPVVSHSNTSMCLEIPLFEEIEDEEVIDVEKDNLDMVFMIEEIITTCTAIFLAYLKEMVEREVTEIVEIPALETIYQRHINGVE